MAGVFLTTTLLLLVIPQQASAQNWGNIAGGVAGGIIAGAIAAQAAQQPRYVYVPVRTYVVPRRHVVKAAPRRAPAVAHSTAPSSADLRGILGNN